MCRRVALGIAWVLVLGLARPALGNPGYLPPFLDRVPSAGDHWLYSTDAPEAPGTYRAEVVEVSAVPDGYRYLVEYEVDIEPGIHPPPSRIEWFLLADGSIWRGSAWVGGGLADGPGKPFRVIGTRRLGPLGKQRFLHVGYPKPVKRRGWIFRVPGGMVWGDRPFRAFAIRSGDRDHPTLRVTYDAEVGMLSWTDRLGEAWTFESATIDGVPHLAPLPPLPLPPLE